MLHLGIVRLSGTPARNGDELPAWGDLRPMRPNDFSQLSPDAIAHDSVTQTFAGDQTKLKFRKRVITQQCQNKKAARLTAPLFFDPREITGLLQMKAGGEMHGAGLPALGMLLHVALVVNFHTHRHETLATTGAAATQNVAAIFGLHALAETKLVFPGALGCLVGPLGHNRVGC